VNIVRKEFTVALQNRADALLAVIDRQCVIGGRPPDLQIAAGCSFEGIIVCPQKRP
jgi:hypothetical protein